MCVEEREPQRHRKRSDRRQGRQPEERFTVKGSERQPSGNNRSRDRKKREEVGCSFLLPSFASLYQS